jgi:hypothetical protein
MKFGIEEVQKTNYPYKGTCLQVLKAAMFLFTKDSLTATINSPMVTVDILLDIKSFKGATSMIASIIDSRFKASVIARLVQINLSTPW